MRALKSGFVALALMVTVAACQGASPAVTSAGTSGAVGPGSSTGGFSASTGGASGGASSGTGGGVTSGGSGTTTGPLMGSVTTLAGDGDEGSGCLLGDAGYFQPLSIGAIPAGGVDVATGSFDQVILDGGIRVLLSAAVARGALGGGGVVGAAVSPSGAAFLASTTQIFRFDGANATLFVGNGVPGNCDDSDADGGAGFFTPEFLAADGNGNLFVTDNYANQQTGGRGCTRIRQVTAAGVVTTLAGNGYPGNSDGPALSASFNFPTGLAADQAGNVYVADLGNNRIRKIANGQVSTLAGNGNTGFDDGSGGAAGTVTFNGPGAVAVGPDGSVYVADTGNNSIRKISPDGTTVTLAGNGTIGYVDGTLGRQGTSEFNTPASIAIDGAGRVYVGDYANCRVRVIEVGP